MTLRSGVGVAPYNRTEGLALVTETAKNILLTPEELEAEGDRIARKALSDDAFDLQTLIKKYGADKMSYYTTEYSNRLSDISLTNQALAGIDTENDENNFGETYDSIVEKIMAATQAYYQFVGKLPEDVRKSFLKLYNETGSEDDGLQIDDLSQVIGVLVPPLKDILPSMQTLRPKNYIMQVDTITNHLPALTEMNRLKVGMRGNQPVKTTVTLDIPEHMKIEGGTVLSTYDKSVINGVTSLLESGNMAFSIPMLYHAMTGKQNPTVDEPLYEELSGKLEKMRRMMISIDLSDENKAQYLSGEDGELLEISDMKIEGYLLPLNKVTAMVNGKKAEVFQLLNQPPIYTYSKMKHQLTSIPISLLNAPINNNATTIPLKSYLLQRIELMKNKNNSIRSSNILYESIYAELPGATDNKTRKMRIRNYTATILGYLKEQGYIAGFAEYKAGRTVAGITIEL